MRFSPKKRVMGSTPCSAAACQAGASGGEGQAGAGTGLLRELLRGAGGWQTSGGWRVRCGGAAPDGWGR